MLRELRDRDIGLAVATGKSGPRARSLLEQLGLLDLFTVVIGSDEVARPKPAPDIVLKALDVLGSDPWRTIMVGDAVTDLTSARGAGVAAVAALWGETDEETLLAESPDVVLRSPSELLEVCMAAAPARPDTGRHAPPHRGRWTESPDGEFTGATSRSDCSDAAFTNAGDHRSGNRWRKIRWH